MIRVPLRDEIPNVNYIKNQKTTYRAPEPKTPAPEQNNATVQYCTLKAWNYCRTYTPGVKNQK